MVVVVIQLDDNKDEMKWKSQEEKKRKKSRWSSYQVVIVKWSYEMKRGSMDWWCFNGLMMFQWNTM